MKLPPEVETGNIEYKLKITTDCSHRIDQLATQMQWRLNEGKSIAKYLIGVADDGEIKGIELNDYIKTLKNFSKITKIINAKITSTKKIDDDNNLFYYEIIITSDIKEIFSTRIIFIGPSNSGKSTIIGNLIKKIKDNGEGKSRKFVFNHKHEIYSGITSSISIKNLKKKYDDDNIYNISLIDTPGNFKYQKTMFTCLSKYRPNLVILTIDPLEIDIKQLKYYLDILKYFKFPFYIIFSKSDKYTNIHKNYLLKNILEICKKNYNDSNLNKIPYIEVNNISKSGYKKIDNLFKYYSTKPPKLYGKNYDNETLCNTDNNIQIQVCDILNVPNISKIFTGLTLNEIDLNKKYILSSPSFELHNIKINSIYFLDQPKQKINFGHLITFTLDIDIDIDNKSDIILSSKSLDKKYELFIKSNNKINNTQGICIYNNQYNVIKIKYINDNKYCIKNVDDIPFINLSNKIIIKVDDKYYYTEIIN